ncbi:DUF3422 domain-containing protein [Rhizobium sp. SYY.PMSO]|uniref:DUF3422 domain-containing protein n=1 Tax=Rhizobium sp. SYY.PMSO TaxID=3382192 RepID=UPI000DDCEB79
MSTDFNAELHARPSIYFNGPAFVEHVALLPKEFVGLHKTQAVVAAAEGQGEKIRSQVEYHTEFVTITTVRELDEDVTDWPDGGLSLSEAQELAGAPGASLVCRTSILIAGAAPSDLGPALSAFGFGDTAASSIGGGAAQICSDFRVRPDETSRIVLFNKELNAYRLGRMVRRIYEIETYRSMALLGLPEARRLAPRLDAFDSKLVELTDRNLATSSSEHKALLDEITGLSSQIISAAAATRNRFGATAAYAQIVEERIAELREAHVDGFQRFGVFVARRFKPAIRTCAATAVRLDRLSHATMHLIDLLQTRIQVEIEYQNLVQIQAMADRAATQVKIQRAVEGFSIIAISYYLLSLLKTGFEALDHAGYHLSPVIMLVSIPIVICAVIIAVWRVKHALESES